MDRAAGVLSRFAPRLTAATRTSSSGWLAAVRTGSAPFGWRVAQAALATAIYTTGASTAADFRRIWSAHRAALDHIAVGGGRATPGPAGDDHCAAWERARGQKHGLRPAVVRTDAAPRRDGTPGTWPAFRRSEGKQPGRTRRDRQRKHPEAPRADAPPRLGNPGRFRDMG